MKEKLLMGWSLQIMDILFFFEPLIDAFLETQHENTLLANTTYTKVICLLRLDIYENSLIKQVSLDKATKTCHFVSLSQ